MESIPGFTALDVRPDMDNTPWDDLADGVVGGQIERIGLLRNGTTQGRASVAILIRLEDGQVVIGETTWRLLSSAVRALGLTVIGQEEAARND